MAMTIAELKQQARDKRAEQEAANNAHQEAMLKEMHRVLTVARAVPAIGEYVSDEADYNDYTTHWTVTHNIPHHCAITTEWGITWADVVAAKPHAHARLYMAHYYTGTCDFDDDGKAHAHKSTYTSDDLGEILLFSDEKYMRGDDVAQMVRDAQQAHDAQIENKKAAAALSPALTAWERLQDALSEIIADAIADTQ